jgi:hypothetical protein
MAFPFNNPFGGDGDPPEWEPPDYAQAVDDSGDNEWQPPSYAKAVDAKSEEKSIFKRAYDTITNKNLFVPKLKEIKKEELPNPSSEERIKAADELKDPGQGSYDPNKHAETKSFLDSVTEAIKGAAETVLPSTTPSDYWKGPAYAIRHLIDSAELTAKALYEAHKEQIQKAKESPTLSEKIGHGAAALLPVIGPAAASAGENIGEGNTARGLGQAAGLLAPFAAHAIIPKFLKEESAIKPESVTAEEPLPIRRNVRTDLTKRALKDTTPQQDAVAIALTKDDVPRTPKNISDETGIPQPSVRRTMSELEKKSTTDQERLPISAKIFADEVPVRQADKLKNDPYEFAGESIRQPEAVQRDFGYSEADSLGPEYEKAVAAPQNEQKLLEGGNQEQPPIQQPVKPIAEKILEQPTEPPNKSFNPFAKKSTESGTTLSSLGAGQGEQLLRIAKETGEDIRTAAKRLGFDPTEEELQDLYSKVGKIGLVGQANEKPSPDRSPNLDPNLFKIGTDSPGSVGRSTEDQLYDIARNRHNMGKDLPGGVRPKVEEPISQSAEGWKPPEYAKIVEPKEPFDLFEEATKDKGPVKAGLPYLDENGEVIGHTTDTEGSTGFKPVEAAGEEKSFQSGQFSKYEEGQKFADEVSGKPSEEIPKKETSQSPDDITELHGGLGGIKPSSRVLESNSGPYGKALDKLFQSMGDIKEARVSQDKINKVEQARRFAKFASIKDEGVLGASKQLSSLKGEFNKVDLDKLKMTQPQVDSLFTAVKRAKITDGERARGYTALFKLFNGEGVPQRNELAILDEVFGQGFANKITELHGGIGAVGINIAKVASTAKSMNNMFSLAPALRHGAGFAARKEFYPAFRDMFKFYGNKEFFDSSMQAIKEHPDYMKFKEAGGYFSNIGNLMGAEEEFLNSFIGEAPKWTGIPQSAAASSRAYTGFMNKVRFDTAIDMFKKAEKLGHKLFTEEHFVNTDDMKAVNRLKKFAKENGISSDIKNPEFVDLAKKNNLISTTQIASKEAKAITRYVNIVSGRGELPYNLDRVVNELNMVLWSPKMMSSRIQMFTNPKIYTDLPQGMRIDGLKALLGIASIGTAITTLNSIAGAKVSSNILSSDFMKSRFPNNNVVDPWGGRQQLVVAAARFLANKDDSSRPTNRMEITGKYLKNQESPLASFVHDLATAKSFEKTDPINHPLSFGGYTNQYNQKTSIPTELVKRFTPILIQDLEALMHSEPDWSKDIGLDVAMGAASLAGMHQSYTERQPSGGLKLRKLGIKPNVK